MLRAGHSDAEFPQGCKMVELVANSRNLGGTWVSQEKRCADSVYFGTQDDFKCV